MRDRRFGSRMPGEALSPDEWRKACGELIRTRLEALRRNEVIDEDWRTLLAQFREEFAVEAAIAP